MNTRHWIYRHIWWLGLPVGIIISAAILRSNLEGKGTLIGSLVAVDLGFCYFALRQLLDELRLFKELFVEFNKRYNDIHDALLDIRDGRCADRVKAQRTLVDYFTLCAEEYVFHERGHIPNDVWRSWCRGMLFVLDHANIRPTWDDEVTQDSYYGLTMEKIRQGAR